MRQGGGWIALQDGDREWIMFLACTCADGAALPPGLIYPAKGNNVQSSWVESIEPKKALSLLHHNPYWLDGL